MSRSTSTLTIVIGDVDESLAKHAKVYDPAAKLLDRSNYKQFLLEKRDRDTVVYTSLGDLPKNIEIVFHILQQANKIIYYNKGQWSDQKQVDFHDPGSSIQGLTEIILSWLPDSIEIQNYCPVLRDVIPLVDQRKSVKPQMWIVGCSISHGVGVNPNQRYGELLADELDLPCSFLTKPSSSIDWAASQILRSDIKKNDLVIWGLTNPERFSMIHDNQLLCITSNFAIRSPQYKDIIDAKNLDSPDTIYKHYYAIQHVVHYCKKIKAKLILVGLMFGNYSLHRILKTYENYVAVPGHCKFTSYNIVTDFIDLGTDNQHPGPEQHKQYKTRILAKIEQLNLTY